MTQGIISFCTFCHCMFFLSLGQQHLQRSGLWPNGSPDSKTSLRSPTLHTHPLKSNAHTVNEQRKMTLLTPPHVYHKTQASYLSLTLFKLGRTTENFQRDQNTCRLYEIDTLTALLFSHCLSFSLSLSLSLKYFPQKLLHPSQKPSLWTLRGMRGVHECLLYNQATVGRSHSPQTLMDDSHFRGDLSLTNHYLFFTSSSDVFWRKMVYVSISAARKINSAPLIGFHVVVPLTVSRCSRNPPNMHLLNGFNLHTCLI